MTTKADPAKVERILNILRKDPRCPKCHCYLNEAELWQKKCGVCKTPFIFFNDGSVLDMGAVMVEFT